MTEAEAQLIERASAKLGPKAVITDPKEFEPWVSDWRGRVHGASPAMLAPASTQEVAEIVKLAAELRVPLVPQGGNTGMAAGATPPADGSAPPDSFFLVFSPPGPGCSSSRGGDQPHASTS